MNENEIEVEGEVAANEVVVEDKPETPPEPEAKTPEQIIGALAEDPTIASILDGTLKLDAATMASLTVEQKMAVGQVLLAAQQQQQSASAAAQEQQQKLAAERAAVESKARTASADRRTIGKIADAKQVREQIEKLRTEATGDGTPADPFSPEGIERLVAKATADKLEGILNAMSGAAKAEKEADDKAAADAAKAEHKAKMEEFVAAHMDELEGPGFDETGAPAARMWDVVVKLQADLGGDIPRATAMARALRIAGEKATTTSANVTAARRNNVPGVKRPDGIQLPNKTMTEDQRAQFWLDHPESAAAVAKNPGLLNGTR